MTPGPRHRPGTKGREIAMGTGKEQAELWGPGARDWSDYNEPMCTPFVESSVKKSDANQPMV